MTDVYMCAEQITVQNKLKIVVGIKHNKQSIIQTLYLNCCSSLLLRFIYKSRWNEMQYYGIKYLQGKLNEIFTILYVLNAGHNGRAI
jgi:hypothetical protein